MRGQGAVRPGLARQRQTRNANLHERKRMMHLKSLILGCALLLAPCVPALAGPAPIPSTVPSIVEARPALWVARDADTTIYLFGTIHLLKPGMRRFQGDIRAAFDRAQEVVLEVAEEDRAATQASITASALDSDSPPLSARLPSGDGARYLAALEQHDIPPAYFDRVKPWFATFTLTVLPLRTLGYDPESGADRLIETTARAQGKTLTGLETSEQQIGFFASMPDALQLKLLSETLDELPGLPDTIEQMIAAWAAGEPDRLSAIMNESVDSDPELKKRLLTDRNATWADWIKARMDRPGVVFMAVGAGHLAGKGSVQDMLAARGIETSRVRAVR
jgi:uncharacterized protein YbaP (TraB family)